jgi:hypothetical protein
VGRADKVVLRADVATSAAPLERMYILERPSAGRLRIVPLAPDPLQMLASSFNSYVRTPGRIVNQLAVVDRLVEAVPVFSVRIPAGEDASSVAHAVVAHAEKQ